ncbi:hypothetical protein ACLBQX_26885, partial [Klebsiella pneumoniae]
EVLCLNQHICCSGAPEAVQRQIPQRIAARLESLYPAGFELPESDSDVNARQQSGTNGHD